MQSDARGKRNASRSYAWPLSLLAWVVLFIVLFATRPLVAESLGGAVERACFGARGGGRQCLDMFWTFTDAAQSAHPLGTWFLGVSSLAWGIVFAIGVACWVALAALMSRRNERH